MQKRTVNPWCCRNAENSELSRTTPASRRPASVALSRTSTGGTPPMCSNTASIDSQRHSDRSDIEQLAQRALECGSEMTSSWTRSSTPPMTADATP